jgi:hypothetical protein
MDRYQPPYDRSNGNPDDEIRYDPPSSTPFSEMGAYGQDEPGGQSPYEEIPSSGWTEESDHLLPQRGTGARPDQPAGPADGRPDYEVAGDQPGQEADHLPEPIRAEIVQPPEPEHVNPIIVFEGYDAARLQEMGLAEQLSEINGDSRRRPIPGQLPPEDLRVYGLDRIIAETRQGLLRAAEQAQSPVAVPDDAEYHLFPSRMGYIAGAASTGEVNVGQARGHTSYNSGILLDISGLSLQAVARSIAYQTVHATTLRVINAELPDAVRDGRRVLHSTSELAIRDHRTIFEHYARQFPDIAGDYRATTSQPGVALDIMSATLLADKALPTGVVNDVDPPLPRMEIIANELVRHTANVTGHPVEFIEDSLVRTRLAAEPKSFRYIGAALGQRRMLALLTAEPMPTAQQAQDLAKRLGLREAVRQLRYFEGTRPR